MHNVVQLDIKEKKRGRPAVWPDWAIFWTLGHFLKSLAAINLPNSLTFLGNFLKVSKSIIFLVKSFLGNFYGYLAIFSGHTAVQCHSKIKKLGLEVEPRQTKHIFSIYVHFQRLDK